MVFSVRKPRNVTENRPNVRRKDTKELKEAVCYLSGPLTRISPKSQSPIQWAFKA